MRTPSWATVPSNFNGEQRKEWSNFLNDPRGADPHRDTGSRGRPISIAAKMESDVDELWSQMVKRGIVASKKPKRSKAKTRGRGRK